MEDKFEIGMCRTDLGGHTEYIYRYYLLEEKMDMQVFDKSLALNCYGIEILREKYVDGKVVDLFRDSVNHVSTEKDKVINLIGYLRDNEVSPIHLIDITGEFADKWVEDFDDSARKLLNKSFIA